jgi:hypothetical protein
MTTSNIIDAVDSYYHFPTTKKLKSEKKEEVIDAINSLQAKGTLKAIEGFWVYNKKT